MDITLAKRRSGKLNKDRIVLRDNSVEKYEVYTGINDVNDNEIFTGDIVELYDEKWTVSFSKKNMEFILIPCNKERLSWYDCQPLLRSLRKKYKKIMQNNLKEV